MYNKEWTFVYGQNLYLFILDKKQAVDIDDKEDFEIAKALLNLKNL
jgi:CMP-N-acetylneuraminic acid synthetase